MTDRGELPGQKALTTNEAAATDTSKDRAKCGQDRGDEPVAESDEQGGAGEQPDLSGQGGAR